MKTKLKDKDIDCSHYKSFHNGTMENCLCLKKFKGMDKNLRFWFKNPPKVV